MIAKIDSDTLDFLAKKKLTFNQFCICLLIHHQDVTAIIKYTNEIGYLGDGIIKRSQEIANKLKSDTEVVEIEDLIKRKFLKHVGVDKDDYYNLDNFIVTEKFTNGFLLTEDVMAKEVWELYLDTILIQGQERSAKSVIFEEFKDFYIKTIEFDPITHSIIKEVLANYRKTHTHAEMGIMKWIGSKQWQRISKEGRAKPRLF